MNERWERVTSLFAAARVLHADQRASFLAIACEGDDALRADVEALLASDTADDDFLQDPPWAHLTQVYARQLEGGQLLKNRYRIDSQLGEGGQALVYRATDVLLTRPVVIKVMRAEGRGNRWLKSRFEQEMKALARIEHSGVIGILDVGELDDTAPFLVIQHVEGVSLREALSHGPLPPARAARILRQMGSALHAAHAAGIAHRDLKPENVLLQSRDGDGEAVKLIDFGIAKIDRSELAPSTTTVTVVGTVRYMAPEQFEGKYSPASDIYSMALIACEMLSGQPHVRALPRSTPAKARAALEAALAYQPEERPTDARRWSEELAGDLVARRRHAREYLAAAPQRLLARRSTATLFALALGTASVLFVGRSLRAPSSPVLGAVTAVTFEPGLEIEPSLSPDGRFIAYAGGAPSRLYLRQRGGRSVLLVPPDSGPAQHRPRWSPDGGRIAFDAGHKVFVIPALGGVPREIVADGWSPTWAPDGQRIAYARGDTVFTSNVSGEDPARLAVAIEPAELAWSPDGRWVALTSGNDSWDGFVHIGNLAQSRIILVSTDDGHVVDVTDRSAMNVAPTWSPDGRQLLFISNRSGARDIYAVRLGTDGSVIGEPTRLSTGLDAHSMAISPSGDRLVYASYQARVNIWSLPIPDGAPVGIERAVALTTGTQMTESISVSPDRRWLYFTSDRAGNSDIWRMPLAGGDPVQVTSDPADDFAPEQSPDGKWLAFFSMRGGTRDIWVVPTEPGEPLRLTDNADDEHDPHWSPDGQSLCYSHHTGARGSLEILRREGSAWSNPITLLDAAGAPNRLLGCAGWLPDGRHMVVQDPAHTMIALMPAAGGALQVLYTADAASGRPRPLWVRVDPETGRIYFRDWTSIWSLEAGNDEPRQIVRLDDPTRTSTRIEMDVDGEHVFFSLGDPQSDLFEAELSLPGVPPE